MRNTPTHCCLYGMLVLLFATSVAQADPTGAFTWQESDSTGMKVGTSPGNLSYSGNINTAQYFEIGGMVARAFNATGIFSGMTSQDLGVVDFNLNDPKSLTFGNAYLGSFQSTSINVDLNTPGSLNLTVLGLFAGGTYTNHNTPFINGPANFTIILTQAPVNTGTISDHGVLNVTAGAQIVPEPTSLMLATSGMIALGAFKLRFRSFRANQHTG